MSKITKYLKQQCKVRAFTSLDMEGNYIYDDPVTVACRRVMKLQDIVSTGGAIVRSETEYILDTTTSVAIGYLLDDKPIVAFEEYVGRNGNLEGYKVVV